VTATADGLRQQTALVRVGEDAPSSQDLQLGSTR
jgi:hypothetical protein